MTRIVGLTGGIASGKSAVAEMLRDLGAVVIDADAIVHELQQPGAPVLAEMIAAFGSRIVDKAGVLDREALGQIVFADSEQRARLGAIVHPRVAVEMARRLEAARAQGVPLVVLDIPLLLESRAAGRSGASTLPQDAVIVVWVPESTQLERQMRRDGRARDEALRRISAQLSLDEKRKLADYVIDNSGSLEETRSQVQRMYDAITKPAPAEKRA